MRKVIKNDDTKINDEISKVKNPFQMILVILRHPVFYIPISIILILLITASTLKVAYVNGHWVWEKKALNIDKTFNKTLDKATKIQEVLKEK